MAGLLLSGGAYGADWLPLVLFPLGGTLLLLYGGDLAIKYYKKWRLRRENRLIKQLTTDEQEPDP